MAITEMQINQISFAKTDMNPNLKMNLRIRKKKFEIRIFQNYSREVMIMVSLVFLAEI